MVENRHIVTKLRKEWNFTTPIYHNYHNYQNGAVFYFSGAASADVSGMTGGVKKESNSFGREF